MKRSFLFLTMAILASCRVPIADIIPPVKPIQHYAALNASAIVYNGTILVSWRPVIGTESYLIQWSQKYALGYGAYWGENIADPNSSYTVSSAKLVDGTETFVLGSRWYIYIWAINYTAGVLVDSCYIGPMVLA